MEKRTDVKTIQEAKEVLTFLGVKESEFSDVYDFDVLLAMICERESALLDKCNVDVVINNFKEIFNTFAPMEKRIEELEKLFVYSKEIY